MIDIKVGMGVVFIIAVVWLYLRWKNTSNRSTPATTDKKLVTEQAKAPELETVAPAIKTPEANKAIIIPEEATLKRHYLQNATAQQTENKPIHADKKQLVKDLAESPSLKAVMPEEMELKRDVIQRLVAETEVAMSPRPTDSMLKRHHDTQLMSSVLSKLQAQK